MASPRCTAERDHHSADRQEASSNERNPFDDPAKFGEAVSLKSTLKKISRVIQLYAFDVSLDVLYVVWHLFQRFRSASISSLAIFFNVPLDLRPRCSSSTWAKVAAEHESSLRIPMASYHELKRNTIKSDRKGIGSVPLAMAIVRSES